MPTVLLADLIRGVGISDEVPATSATHATQAKGVDSVVATVATVTVANSPEPEVGCFSSADRQEVLLWLALTGETNQDVVDSVLSRCESDPEARTYFMMRVNDAQKPCGDERRHCDECGNLDKYGYCLAALRGELDGLARKYQPWRGLPRRCDCFRPI